MVGCKNPIGAEFNYQTMRMEMTSFAEVVLNPVAQVKFLHTVASAYTCGAMFILGVSCTTCLKGETLLFAKRSFAVAASFGIASIISVIVLGDESGYELGDVQKVKLASRQNGTPSQLLRLYLVRITQPRGKAKPTSR
ncbi:cytochrome ubiquinol oxidase subunit I [Vibrio lentus]|nr:cytochrome ubiquinol oxidase subunit I [Vibrio lentus]